MLPFATTWMDLNDNMLSETSQTKKDKYYLTHVWNLKTNKLILQRKQTGGCQR